MTDRPIIFSAPMVRALLREAEAPGTGKMQTRRLLSSAMQSLAREPAWEAVKGADGIWRFLADTPDVGGNMTCDERYAVGDRLWVRERFLPDPSRDDDAWDSNRVSSVEWDGTGCRLDDIPPGLRQASNCIFMADPRWAGDAQGWLWRPSIYMPRWASRLTLVVADVRVQRLQDISEADARAEGLLPAPGGWWSGAEGQAGATPRAAYAVLWNSLHGPSAWADNPWIVAVTFDVVRANIDALPQARAA